MMSEAITIREAKGEDCVEIRKLIQVLADYEKMPSGPKIDAKTLEKDGFDTEPPLFYCYVAENAQKKLVGFALYTIAYSTWSGKRFWLEDIAVSESHRRHGVGSMLMLRVIKRAAELNCQIFNFNVLGWNPAEKFYKRFGAVDLTKSDDWHFYTIPKEKFVEIANTGKMLGS